jgi:hypothetical protein
MNGETEPMKQTEPTEQIQDLIIQISQQEIPCAVIDSKQVDRLFQIIECLMKKKPVNITNYSISLIPITTKDKCIICQRQAVYMILNQEKEKYCWIHSQNLNN